MTGAILRRAFYRARQFGWAIQANLRPLSRAEVAEAQAVLPEAAWPLFRAMPGQDQRHGLEVLRSLRVAGEVPPSLAQAALLHDCAKRVGGIRLWHRVGIVLIRAFLPALIRHWEEMAVPEENNWRYPFWAQIHHPEQGARLAVAVGCDPQAVSLIRYHGAEPPPDALDPQALRLLRRLQAADDDH